MALTNHDRVGKAMELLKQGLAPFVERELRSVYTVKAQAEALRLMGEDRLLGKKPLTEWDTAALLKLMWEAWNEVFRRTLGPAERSLISELRDHRNRWAHQQAFSGDDAYRALDSAERILTAVSAREADEINKAKNELLRTKYDEQVRSEKRKSAGTAIESQVTGVLKPWREVVTPHRDVASGRYQQAEFAADLWQVYIGEGTDEYRTPQEFFRRTYPTESLKQLLTGAVRRLTGRGGDPVVQLQTNFGGGKTHSMLALFHLFSGAAPAELLGIDEILKDTETTKLPSVQRVVLVGNKLSPGNPTVKADGTVVRTLWGELAWQLGFAKGGVKEAKKAFKRIAADDERATSPGDVLRELMNEYGPCLILVDEWVAYARQLHDDPDLPGGSFETHFSFAQALTESAKLAKQCLLVISLPASDTTGSPHARAEDVEVGGERGRDALERLRNAVGRVEASWRPASAEEGFEIVRRRLFEPLVEKSQFVARDTVARAFAELYQTQQQEFPMECRDSDYEKRMRAAYPIHPEVFDRLYTDWSTLVKFQRTRGVLRLMAAAIHTLWEKGDRNPLIMPANLAIEDRNVQFELTRYLSDNWVPVIEKDVDGPSALPLRLDGELPNLGKYAACRRVARTIYLGSAPTATAANRGIEDRRIKLGCVMPGESAAIFGDALRRLAKAATYLYEDGSRYWYSTQPTVTKLAEDRAEQLKRNPDSVTREIEQRLRADLRRAGDFTKVHVAPSGGQDVMDEPSTRLVVLGIDKPYSKDPGNAAEVAAKAIFEARGNTPRLYRNGLVFLAVDATRLQDLDEAVRRYLAWQSIVAEKDELNLTPFQEKQAATQRDGAESTVSSRLPESYCWMLVPAAASPQSAIEWQATKLSTQGALAARVSDRLRKERIVVPAWGASLLRMDLDRVPLWRGDHVSIAQLTEDYAQYTYLQKLQSSKVLVATIEEGVGLLTWAQDGFAYADAFDSQSGRYRGLRAGAAVSVTDPHSAALLVRPEVAQRQLAAEAQPVEASHVGGAEGEGARSATGPRTIQVAQGAPSRVATSEAAGRPKPRRFHGSVELDPARMGRDAGQIGEEVIAHLAGMVNAKVRVTLEIEGQFPEGASESTVRTVTENAAHLKFASHAFEED